MNTRRILPYDEYERLRAPIKKLFGEDKEPPHPMFSMACAVEEDEQGEILGFLFLQLVPHLEPFGSLGGASFSGLRQIIDDTLTNYDNLVYYLYADNPKGLITLKGKGFEVVGTLMSGSPNKKA